jgi:hypothetical protein
VFVVVVVEVRSVTAEPAAASLDGTASADAVMVGNMMMIEF